MIHFSVGNYDHTRPLIIDPIIEYATYVDATLSNDPIYDIAIGSDGTMYLVGRASEFFTLSVQTTSTVFPTPSSPSLQDMTYVAKIHSTYDAQGHAQQPVLDYTLHG